MLSLIFLFFFQLFFFFPVGNTRSPLFLFLIFPLSYYNHYNSYLMQFNSLCIVHLVASYHILINPLNLHLSVFHFAVPSSWLHLHVSVVAWPYSFPIHRKAFAAYQLLPVISYTVVG